MSQNLALFDFDGTITTKDTFIEFIKFYKGTFSLLGGLFILSPYLIAMKFKLYPNWKAKEKVIRYFFKNEPIHLFNQQGKKFCDNKLPYLIKPNALKKLEEHKNKGDKVYIISASAENWVLPWAQAHNVELIATKLEVENQKLTGNISGKNCYGVEKVNRLKKFLSITDYIEISVYGDSSGDKELLELATHPNYRIF